MSREHKINTGYDLAAGLFDKYNGNLDAMVKLAGGRETAWLEFKADPFCRSGCEGKKQDDYSWHILRAVIAFANTCGGCILIGVDDNGKSVPLRDKDSGEVNCNLDKFSRELQDVLFSKEHFSIRNPNEKNPNRVRIAVNKEQWRNLTDLRPGHLNGNDVLVLLVKEAENLLTHKEDGQQIMLVRKTNCDVGAENQPLTLTEVMDHMKNRPEIQSLSESCSDQHSNVSASSRPVQNANQLFFNEWITMIQKLEGMESLLQNNEHDALQVFCGIVEKAIGDMDMFCFGQRRKLSLEEPEIHEVWAQLIQPCGLKNKLKITTELQFPDLSEIEKLKAYDCQHSPKLRRCLLQLFYTWMNFADQLKEFFPSVSEENNLIAQNLPRIFEEMEFIGRKEQLDEILQFLSHRENRNYFLTITGEGGMGKSTLALAAAHAVLNHDPKTSGVAKEDLFYQNIIWASAKERDFRDQREYALNPDIKNYAGLLDTILDVLDPGHSMADMNAKQNKVRQILQSTRSLLIIDNMETINDDHLFDYLKNKIPSPTKIIGTDRNRAKTDRAIHLHPMNREESKSLIISLAGEKGNFLSEEDFARFYELSYGIPKVIEWGCRLLNRHEAGIEDVFRYLTLAQQEGTKNQIYEYLFGYSYDHLSPAAKRILNVLTLFDFPIQCRLIGPLTGMEKGIDEYIDELSSYTLLLVTGNGGERSLFEKYADVQEYIRIYAALKADSSADFDKFEIYSNAKKVFLRETIRICGKNGWPNLKAYDWCKKNLSMINWLFQQLVEAENITDIHSFIISVVPVLSNIGIPDEIESFCRNALAVILNISDSQGMNFNDYVDLMLRSFRQAEKSLKNTAADIMEQWAWNMFRQLRFKEVSEILNEIRTASLEITNPRVNILVLRTLGLIDKEQNLLDSAEEKLLCVIEQCKQHQELHIEAITYGSLSSLYRDKNDLEKACSYMEKAFQTVEKIEDQSSVKEILSVFYQKYAKLMIKSGNLEKAQIFIQKAMIIDEQIHRLYGFAHNKQLKAIIHEQTKNYSQAYHLIREARDIFVRLNSGKEIETDYERIKKLYESQLFT